MGQGGPQRTPPPGVANEGFKSELVDTKFGESLAVKVDFIVCVDDLAFWKNQFVYGAVLVGDLELADENVFVGRLSQGEKRPGKNPAWVWAIPTDGDIELVNAFLNKYAVTAPSGTIILDEKAIAADRPEPGPDF